MKKVLFLILVSSQLQSQTIIEKKSIIAKTDVSELMIIKNRFDLEYSQREFRIREFLDKNSNYSKKYTNEFQTKEIYDIVDGFPIYYNTSNLNSSKTIKADKLYTGGGLNLSIQGENMYAIVWDGGNVRTTHTEFPNNKVSNLDGVDQNEHSTHVTGTITAKGININLRGIAFESSVGSYNWDNDYAEMTSEAANGLLVSNHSYWMGQNAIWNFGSYDNRAKQFDEIAFAAPYYLAVTAAGNERDNYDDPVVATQLNLKNGYNLTRGMQNAKNFLTVGAVYQVLNYTDPSSVVISSFSSYGPTDDGRIKPDIVAKGVSVKSTTITSDTSSANLQGTSMASPAVAGGALLLQQYYNQLNSNYMKAATAKGLILHTAKEAGIELGPDYEYGWGLMDVENAANVITNKSIQKNIIEENVLNNNQTYTKTIYSDGTKPIMCSISWTDRAYPSANSGTTDPTTQYLVNDLDIRITKDNTTYYPWTLNPNVPWDPAVRTQDNFRDNFEKIQIDNPIAGPYTVTVSHKGSLVGSFQNYSLIVSGIDQTLGTVNNNFDKSIFVYPNPASSILNFNITENIELLSISISDISGKNVMQIPYSDSIQNKINLENLQSGVYFVKFTTKDNVSVVKKIVKE